MGIRREAQASGSGRRVETIEVWDLHGLAVLDQTCCTVCWSAFVVVHELI